MENGPKNQNQGEGLITTWWKMTDKSEEPYRSGLTGWFFLKKMGQTMSLAGVVFFSIKRFKSLYPPIYCMVQLILKNIWGTSYCSSMVKNGVFSVVSTKYLANCSSASGLSNIISSFDSLSIFNSSLVRWPKYEFSRLKYKKQPVDITWNGKKMILCFFYWLWFFNFVQHVTQGQKRDEVSKEVWLAHKMKVYQCSLYTCMLTCGFCFGNTNFFILLWCNHGISKMWVECGSLLQKDCVFMISKSN